MLQNSSACKTTTWQDTAGPRCATQSRHAAARRHRIAARCGSAARHAAHSCRSAARRATGSGTAAGRAGAAAAGSEAVAGAARVAAGLVSCGAAAAAQGSAAAGLCPPRTHAIHGLPGMLRRTRCAKGVGEARRARQSQGCPQCASTCRYSRRCLHRWVCASAAALCMLPHRDADLPAARPASLVQTSKSSRSGREERSHRTSRPEKEDREEGRRKRSRERSRSRDRLREQRHQQLRREEGVPKEDRWQPAEAAPAAVETDAVVSPGDKQQPRFDDKSGDVRLAARAACTLWAVLAAPHYFFPDVPNHYQQNYNAQALHCAPGGIQSAAPTLSLSSPSATRPGLRPN